MKDKVWQGSKVLINCLFGVICAGILGCVTDNGQVDAIIPRELRMTLQPLYVI
jgi:hypothetical protein